MHSDLLAYLSGSLDEPARTQFDTRLRSDTELREQVDRARTRLAPLLERTIDDADMPPPGLVIDTLARVAEKACQRLPASPTETTVSRPMFERPWWRRADVLVAGSIAATVLALLLPALLHLRVTGLRVECENSLREMWHGLSAYHTQKHQFPDVAKTTRPAAGMVVPMLRDAGVLSPTAQACCPAVAGACLNVGLHDVDRMSPSEFEAASAKLLPGFAYSLGYRDGDRLHGPVDSLPGIPASRMPLLADATRNPVSPGSSDNHTSRGQNVLYSDGHVAFNTLRDAASIPGDDIYLNQAQRIAAGLGQHDVVLATGGARP